MKNVNFPISVGILVYGRANVGMLISISTGTNMYIDWFYFVIGWKFLMECPVTTQTY